MLKEIEIWKEIKGFEGLYEVSNMGRYRSMDRVTTSKTGVKRTHKSRIMSLTKEGIGYTCSLHRDNKTTKYRMHEVVAQHFVDNPNQYHDVIHIDTDTANNTSSNLRFVSQAELQVIRHGAAASECECCHKPMAVSKGKSRVGAGRYCSRACKHKDMKGQPPWNKGKDCVQFSGDKHWNWKGGASNKATEIRHTYEYSKWKKEVLKRDGKQCFFCGCTDGPFHIDHIKPFVDHIDLRFEPSNGRVVCAGCHRKTPTYGVAVAKRSVANKKLKRRIIELSYKHKISHLGSNLTAIDVILKIFKKKGENERFYLSAGHYALALFVVLESWYGYDAEVLMLKHGTHCKKDEEHKIYCINGSLGCVIGIATGHALGDRTRKVHCLISDGEVAEGSVIEALKVKRDNKLYNLEIHVNMNGLGAYGIIDVEQMMKELLLLDRDIKIYHTNPNQLPFLKDLDAHYLIMNEDNYKQAMEILK